LTYCCLNFLHDRWIIPLSLHAFKIALQLLSPAGRE
jgi:hypothetical protein